MLPETAAAVIEEEVIEPQEPVEPVEVDEGEEETWMKEEDEQAPKEDPSKQVPVGKHVALKKKLRGTIKEQDDEIERLKKENAALQKPQAPAEPALRPKREDFDSDDLFDEAIDGYRDERTRETLSQQTAQSQQQADIEKSQARLNDAVDTHYLRAAQLIEKTGIKPEIFKASDVAVRKAVDSVMPERGERVVDEMISRIGDGSDKVMYYLGRNQAALDRLKSLLVSDPSGIEAAIYLGQEKQRLTNPTKPRTQAPDPAARLTGDAPSGAKHKALKRAYDKAHNGGGIQDAYNAKKAAKQAGVDVSKW